MTSRSSVYRHSDDMDLRVHVDDITLSGDYDVVMRTTEALKLELQVKISEDLTKTGHQTKFEGKTTTTTTK